ncbi:MAG: hypothetical protein PHO27_09230 [Sulfuricurvum sp.]|nr:hypothetical protein [Sulfuricurvum sp.]
MQTLRIEIQDDLKDTLLNFLKLFPTSAVKIYEDDDSEDEIISDQRIDEVKSGKMEVYTLDEVAKKLNLN